MKKTTLNFRVALLIATALLVSYTVNAQNTPLGTPAAQNPDGTTSIPGTPAACATGFSFYTIDHEDENTGAFLPAGIGVTTSLVNNGTTDITITGTPGGAGIGDVDNIVASGGRMNYRSTDGGNANATYNFDVTITNPYIFIGDMETFTTLNIFDCTGNPVSVNLMNGQSRFGALGNSAFITGSTSTNQDGYIQVPGSFDCLVINIDNPAPFTLDVIQVAVGVCAPDISLFSNIEIDANGNLVYTDSDGVDDEITMFVDGSSYRLIDPNGTLVAGNGTTQDGTDVLVPIASVTGNININTLDGDDNFIVDYSGGDFTDSINYNGGNQTTGDILTLFGDGTLNEVTHTFINANDGSIAITGNSLLNYVGLEPVLDNLDANNRIFNFTGGAETITLSDDGNANDGISFIDSTLGESVTFVDPIASLTINAGNGNDRLNVEGVDGTFDAGLTINGDDDRDAIVFQGNPTNVGNGAITVNGEQIFVSQNVSTTGAISLTGTSNVEVITSAVLASTDGDITIIGGNAPAASDNLLGMRVDSGTVRTTGTGNINITGTGSFTSISFRHGVQLRNAGVVETTGTGSITISGTAAASQQAEAIQMLEGSRIESNGGGISLVGQGGNSALGGNRGLSFNDSFIQDVNGGAISLNGQADGTGSNNQGLFISNTPITTSTGTIDIVGNGSVNGIDNNYGVGFLNASVVSSSGGNISITGNGLGSGNINRGLRVIGGSSITNTGTGNITINGSAISGVENNDGVEVNGGTISTVNGAIQITANGFGDGTGSSNRGIRVRNGSNILASGTGAITINATGGNGINANQGIFIQSPGTTISAVDGTITINGTSGTGSGNNNEGFTHISSALIQTTGNGNIVISGNANGGNNVNKGLVVAGAEISASNGNVTLNGTGDGTGNNNFGVQLESSALISSAGSGTITITGQGGNGVNSNQGIRIEDTATRIAAVNGDITLNGTSGVGTGFNNEGITHLSGALIETTGTGNVSLTGVASGGNDANKGVVLAGASITSLNGDVILDGTGEGTGEFNTGISLEFSSLISSTGGSIIIAGTGGAGTNSNTGVLIEEGSTVQTNAGGIAISGSGGNATGNSNQGVVVNDQASVQDLSTGNISIIGQAGNGVSFNRAIDINNANTSVTSNGGNISFNGTGSVATTGIFNLGTTIRNSANVSTTGTGTINITGIGGVGTDTNYGAEVVGSAAVTTQDGLISITGTNVDNTGAGQIGFRLNSVISATGTGNVVINGTAGTATSSGIELSNIDASISAGGDVTLSITNGPLTSPTGIPTSNLITGTNVVINGAIQPGFEGEGTLPVAGTLALSAGDEFAPSIAGFITAGIDYDQLVVTGVVDITGATLTLVNNTGAPENQCDTLVLIDNDGTDAITGTFAGLPEGASISSGGITGKISYVGGDGNDVVIDLDDTPPTLTCPADITAECPQVITYPLPTFSDNCGIAGAPPAAVPGFTLFGTFGNSTYFISNASDRADNNFANSNANNYKIITINSAAENDFITSELNNQGTGSVLIGYNDLAIEGDFVWQSGEPFTYDNWANGEPNDNLGNEDYTEFRTNGQWNDVSPSFNSPVLIEFVDYSGGPIQLVGLPSGATFPLGVTTNTFIIQDTSGNITTCSFDVTITDTSAPTISCSSDITVSNDPGVCEANVTVPLPTLADNCGNTVLIYGRAAFNFDFDGDLIDTPNTLAGLSSSVVDMELDLTFSGDFNISSEDFVLTGPDGTTIFSEDDIDPVCVITNRTITIPVATWNSWITTYGSSLTFTLLGDNSVDDDQCSSNPSNFYELSIPQLGGNLILINDYNGTADASDTYPVGTTTVTWTVTDLAGNTSSCTQNITVNDTEAPVITCPTDIIVDNDPGVCNAAITVPALQFTDNCPIGNGSNITTITGPLTSFVNNGSELDDTPSTITGVVYTTSQVTVDIVTNGDFEDDDECFVLTGPDGSIVFSECELVPNDCDTANRSFMVDFATWNTWIDTYGANLTFELQANDEVDIGFTGCTDDYQLIANIDVSSTITVTNDYNGTADASDTYPVGTTIVTWTATDAAGNSSTCTQEITVNDVEDTAIVCSNNIMVDTTSANLCSEVVDYDVFVVDNCLPSIPGFSTLGASQDRIFYLSENPFTGATARTDAENNGGFVATITSREVQDFVKARIDFLGSTQAHIGYSDRDAEGTFVWHSGSASTYTLWGTNQPDNSGAGATDADYAVMFNGAPGAWGDYGDSYSRPYVLEVYTTGSLSQTAGLPSGSAFPVGITTNTFEYTDAQGNTVSCSFDVTVNDIIPPTAICQDITVQLDATGNVSITAVNVDNGSSDNCGIASLAVSPSAFDCSNVGSNTVTLTVTDVNGNVSTCTSTVTVEDNVAPDAVCMDIDVFLDATGNVSITPADVDGGSSDACGIASIAIDITDFTCADVGPNNVTLTVTDVNGNSSNCVAVVTVIDNVSPTISCPADVVTGTDPGLCSAQVVFSDAIAGDECGIASVVQTAGLPSGSDFPVGVNTIEFTATDVNGNTTTCSFTITVSDDEDPVAVCQDITIQLDEFGDATITAADVSGVSTDNCGVASTSIDMDTFDCSNVGNNVVTLTVTDVNGNSSTCTAIVTVEDVTAPEVFCQDIIVDLDATGTVTILPINIDNGSTDACGIETYELDIDTFDCSNVGDNTVTLTITDVNGNSASCTAIVTVQDVTDPVLTCMDITVELDENGEAVIEPEDVIDTIEDACGILTTAIDIFEFNCDDIGTPITVQVFANDTNGNLATCTAQVTVVDILAPEITCPADQTVDPGPGNLFYEIPDYFATGEATAVDNCTDPVTDLTQDPAPGTLVPDGVYTITMTATDDNGNTSTCEFELTVESTLGVDDLPVDLSTIVVYPNPATDIVYISNPQNIVLESAAIYDLTGRLIRTIDLMAMGVEKAIDVSLLPTATYAVVMTGENGQIIKRFIKE
ncbi:MAG: hypothetical protein Aureis2KO_01620 [Aureisphaera sp.]